MQMLHTAYNDSRGSFFDASGFFLSNSGDFGRCAELLATKKRQDATDFFSRLIADVVNEECVPAVVAAD